MINMQKKSTHYEFMTDIPTQDGSRLSARVWLPLSSVQDGKIINSTPAVLEYLPYHLMEGTRKRDDLTYAHFAERGYAGIRVDIRGTGNSQGLFEDEYSETELQDGCDVIAWIAEQQWCSGQVGMIGISWGGFNGLQIAYLQPPALKAVITACSTHDRYNGDIHYKGGCQLSDNFGWAQQMSSYLSRPPDPEIYGDDWRETWLKRLKNMPNLAKIWASHQQRDNYWKHGSVCEDYNRIKIPVLAIGGWQDAYTKTVFRLGKNLSACQAIIGPWEHAYPNIAVIAPRIDFLNMACDFWDKHLKSDKNIKADLQCYILQQQKPNRDYADAEGYWVETPVSYEAEKWRLYLNGDTLGEAAAGKTDRLIDSPCHMGAGRRNFCPGMRLDGELADNQASDDELSLCFDSSPLKSSLALLGEVKVTLQLASDKPQANIIARLCDVDEHGQSVLIAWGCLNLSYRSGFARPSHMPINEAQDIKITLTPCGYEVPVGHRLRLALSNHYWSMLWPAPQATRLNLKTAVSYMELPLLNSHKAIDFPPYETPEKSLEILSKGHNWRKFSKQGEAMVCEVFDDLGEIMYPETGVRIWEQVLEKSSIGDSPLSASLHAEWQRTLRRDASGWSTRMISGGDMSADEEYFYFETYRQVFDGDKDIFSKRHKEKVARKFV